MVNVGKYTSPMDPMGYDFIDFCRGALWVTVSNSLHKNISEDWNLPIFISTFFATKTSKF